jgi:hypothetical protein
LQDLKTMYYDNSFNHVDSETKVRDHERIIIDFSEKPEILFIHNNITYYGSRKIVYGNIYLLDDVTHWDLNEPIVLDVDVPKYIILLYIQSCYDGIFDINDIDKDDFKQFLNLVDQYPTKNLSIQSLEFCLINYMDKNMITFDDHLRNICNRYRLKYMYLYFNQEPAIY